MRFPCETPAFFVPGVSYANRMCSPRFLYRVLFRISAVSLARRELGLLTWTPSRSAPRRFRTVSRMLRLLQRLRCPTSQAPLSFSPMTKTSMDGTMAMVSVFSEAPALTHLTPGVKSQRTITRWSPNTLTTTLPSKSDVRYKGGPLLHALYRLVESSCHSE